MLLPASVKAEAGCNERPYDSQAAVSNALAVLVAVTAAAVASVALVLVVGAVAASGEGYMTKPYHCPRPVLSCSTDSQLWSTSFHTDLSSRTQRRPSTTLSPYTRAGMRWQERVVVKAGRRTHRVLAGSGAASGRR